MIDELVVAFTLTLARVGTFTQVVPLLGGAGMPKSVKIGLAMALAAVFFGEASTTLAQAGGPGPLGLTSWVGLALALGREMLLGGVLGLALGMFLVPAHVAAEFITQEAGLSFANVLTATGSGNANSLTVIFELLASAAFLALDLHHVFILVLRETFEFMPIGQGLALPNWDMVVAVSAAEEGGVLLAAPVGLCLFITTVVLAMMTRAAPQMNLYSVGFPLRVLVCLGAMVVMLPQLLAAMVGMFSYFLEFMRLRG